MSTQVEAVFSHDLGLSPGQILEKLRRLEPSVEWRLDLQGTSGPLLQNGLEILRIMPETLILDSSLPWVVFLSNKEERTKFVQRLKDLLERLGDGKAILYPDIGYQMEIVADLAIDDLLSFHQISCVLKENYSDRLIHLSTLNEHPLTADEATDIDAYLNLDCK